MAPQSGTILTDLSTTAIGTNRDQIIVHNMEMAGKIWDMSQMTPAVLVAVVSRLKRHLHQHQHRRLPRLLRRRLHQHRHRHLRQRLHQRLPRLLRQRLHQRRHRHLRRLLHQHHRGQIVIKLRLWLRRQPKSLRTWRRRSIRPSTRSKSLLLEVGEEQGLQTGLADNCDPYLHDHHHHGDEILHTNRPCEKQFLVHALLV
mmetsp:Transcript_155033/g.273838  ORF Transcript_155033/g.273838 Transcript_155033/m.273838 type:complete len:200 (+) Transcript_155033:243-842(+)